jgi:hypothetical protein
VAPAPRRKTVPAAYPLAQIWTLSAVARSSGRPFTGYLRGPYSMQHGSGQPVADR